MLLYFSLIKNNRPNGIIGDPIGRILYSNQGAILRSSESSIWEPAERSVEIFGNEVLRSGSGQVKIEFYESKRTIILSRNTEVVISPKDLLINQIRISIIQGRIFVSPVGKEFQIEKAKYDTHLVIFSKDREAIFRSPQSSAQE